MKFKVGDSVKVTDARHDWSNTAAKVGDKGVVSSVFPHYVLAYGVKFPDGKYELFREKDLELAQHDVLSKDEIETLLSGIDSEIYKDSGMAKVRKQGRDLLEQAYSCGWHDGYAGGKRDAEETAKTERTGKWKRVTGANGEMKVVCSECGGTMEQKHINFCAVCGARMVSIV